MYMPCAEVIMYTSLHLEISYTFAFLHMWLLLKCALNRECKQVLFEVKLAKPGISRFTGPVTIYQDFLAILTVPSFP